MFHLSLSRDSHLVSINGMTALLMRMVYVDTKYFWILSEQKCHQFIQGIKNTIGEKAEHHNRELKQWIGLFTEKMDKQNDCYECIDKYSLSTPAIKGAKSKVVTGDVLLRTLLLQ